MTTNSYPEPAVCRENPPPHGTNRLRPAATGMSFEFRPFPRAAAPAPVCRRWRADRVGHVRLRCPRGLHSGTVALKCAVGRLKLLIRRLSNFRWVKGGGLRQVNGTAGLPSAPDMPCAPGQLRLVPTAAISILLGCSVQQASRVERHAMFLDSLVEFLGRGGKHSRRSV
jgi:hypothetical protein